MINLMQPVIIPYWLWLIMWFIIGWESFNLIKLIIKHIKELPSVINWNEE